MKTKTIKQTVTFNASPHEIYEMLMDSKKHAKLTGASAQISREVGGTTSAYDGWIEGENVELIPDKKIVQRWRGTDWPENHYSIATFELKPTKGGTKLAFTQTGVPPEHYQAISDGWHEHYWQKMNK